MPAPNLGGPFGGPTVWVNGRRPANRRRILMLTSTIAKGGCERQILSTAAGLIEKGYEVAIMAFARAPADEGLDTEFSRTFNSAELLGRVHARSGKRATDHACCVAARGHVQIRRQRTLGNLRYRPHVVHAWSDYAAIVGGSMAVALEVPRIVLGQRNVSPPSHLLRECRDISRGVSNSRVQPASDPHQQQPKECMRVRTLAGITQGHHSRGPQWIFSGHCCANLPRM